MGEGGGDSGGRAEKALGGQVAQKKKVWLGTESEESIEVWEAWPSPEGLERPNKKNKGKGETGDPKGHYIKHFRPFAIMATEIFQLHENIKIKRVLCRPL